MVKMVVMPTAECSCAGDETKVQKKKNNLKLTKGDVIIKFVAWNQLAVCETLENKVDETCEG